MTLDEWRAMRRPESKWRRRARSVIDIVLQEASTEVRSDPAALLKAVDAAYPFGEREHHPYKAWLEERKLFRAALADAPELPSRDEADVCIVARDLVEEGRVDEARKLVEEQAPNRLARRCPACGAKTSVDCFVIDEEASEADYLDWDLNVRAGRCMSVAGDPPAARRVTLVVPHEARLTGHLDAGPLFGARQ